MPYGAGRKRRRMGGLGGFGMMDDSFGEMDQIMRMPMGGMMGDMMGDMMGGMMGGMMGSMMGNLMSGMMGNTMGGMGDGQMMSSMSSFGGGGAFTSQTMCFSSSVGADGKVKTEHFASSSVGDSRRGTKETQQVYSNSHSGLEKKSLERIYKGRGKKVVEEHSKITGDETRTEMFHGMTEEDQDDFHEEWAREAAPHLPRHRSARALSDRQSYRERPRAIEYHGSGGQSSEASTSWQQTPMKDRQSQDRSWIGAGQRRTETEQWQDRGKSEAGQRRTETQRAARPRGPRKDVHIDVSQSQCGANVRKRPWGY